MSDRIRALREARGWSQQELAARAGVTRQQVGAVESGRHLPNVAAAIRLARALGEPVEALFGDGGEGDGATLVPVLDDPGAGSGAVRVGRVGERLVGVPVEHGVEPAEQWAVADAVVEGGQVTWLPGAAAHDLVVAGCDPLLGLLGALVGAHTPYRVLPVHVSTGRALDALRAGRVHGVVVHGPPGSLPDPPRPVRRWHLARWQVGLASPRRGGPPSVAEIADRRLRVVQRDDGAGSQRAFVRALRAAGRLPDLPGPVAGGHVDVARRVVEGAGVAGVTMEAAACAFGLGFAPLEVHDVELWIDDEWRDSRAVAAFVECLDHPALRRRVALLPGYDVGNLGRASA